MKNRLHPQRSSTVRRLPCGFSARNEHELVEHLKICKAPSCKMFVEHLIKFVKEQNAAGA